VRRCWLHANPQSWRTTTCQYLTLVFQFFHVSLVNLSVLPLIMKSAHTKLWETCSSTDIFITERNTYTSYEIIFNSGMHKIGLYVYSNELVYLFDLWAFNLFIWELNNMTFAVFEKQLIDHLFLTHYKSKQNIFKERLSYIHSKGSSCSRCNEARHGSFVSLSVKCKWGVNKELYLMVRELQTLY
jgi:hypothetical protein